MTAEFSAEEILEIVEGRLASGMTPEEAGSISTDTRLLLEQQWFVALAGNTFDGHDFIGDAFSAGALGCIVEERTSYPIASTNFPLIAVSDTAEALCSLARNWRRRLNPRICLVPFSGPGSEQFIDAFEELKLSVNDSSVLVWRNSDWQKIAQSLLSMNEDVRAVLIEYEPQSLEFVEAVMNMSAPNVVLFFPDLFSHLRLQTSPAQIQEARILIANFLKRPEDVVLVSNFENMENLKNNPQNDAAQNMVAFDNFAPELSFAPSDALDSLKERDHADNLQSQTQIEYENGHLTLKSKRLMSQNIIEHLNDVVAQSNNDLHQCLWRLLRLMQS